MALRVVTVFKNPNCCRCFMSQPIVVSPFIASYVRRIATSHGVLSNKAVSKIVKPREDFQEKAKEAAKTSYYSAVIVIGLGLTGLMFYAVFRELLSSFSPQRVYSLAVDLCTSHPRVTDLLGDNLKSFGDESRRGRRQHISHFPYKIDGVKGLRLKFYLSGQRRTATVHADTRETSSGWEFRYLYVQLDSFPYEVIVIQDNRGSQSDLSVKPSLPY